MSFSTCYLNVNLLVSTCTSIFFFFLAPYSFDKDTLFAILEKEKEKVTAKLEHFAQLLRESKVGNCNSV